MSYLLLVLSTKNFFSYFIPRSQFYFSLSCILEGKKNTFRSNISWSLTWDLSAGFGILLQASSTFAINFYLSAWGFSFFYTKSRTTNIICFGFSDPNSFRLSYNITSNIYNWAPLNVPICWIQMLIKSVWEIAKANNEFRRSTFWI